MKKLFMTLLAGTMISTSSFATEPSINITLSDGSKLNTSRSYSSQQSNSLINEDGANKIKAAYELGNMFRPANERTANQLSRWYANLKYSKDTVQNSPWVKKDNNTRRAWLDGHDGNNTNIAVVDNLRDFDINTPWGERYHNISHGDIVSIIAGDKHTVGNTDFIGIAPEANVDQYNIYQINNPRSNLWNADVINLSWGGNLESPTSSNVRGISQSFNHKTTNAVIVKSAGNQHNSCTSVCDAQSLGLINSNKSDQTLIVGTYQDGRMPSYSNKAGVTKDNYVVDEGHYRLRYNIDGYTPTDYMTRGTSFAAPTVAGKAAIIKSKFPNLTGAQIASRIKLTADDLGAPGVDEVYGHGKVNLSRALSPIGSLR